MKNSLKIPIGILIASAICYGLHFLIEDFSFQVKFGFMSKMLLMVGLITLLLFWLGNWKEEKSRT